ncbi:alginate export family protein [Novosphingobium sp. 1949]|uniref:Alginate export family protein n=1 Tax=Novosphingobium organovorum TaxID=2930092 RepID=A0ABT0BBC2_9SPHN|nr:alginate export family protein [Novosphingobium organovorum]MCJ2182362.1 alginate export family protein [Novosphingobium organovorum]
MKTVLSLGFLAAGAASVALASPALAKAGDPVTVADGVTIDPIIDANLRYERVDQDDLGLDADALTLRLRAGAEVKAHGFSVLGEAEGTLAIVDHYNDTIAGNHGYTGAEPYSTVADPQNVEINRLQIAYGGKAGSITLGRQRIILDNARFVGNVGWRQNEQTFDAVRAQGKLGPVALDATYSISQRSIFGADSPNKYWDGNFVLLNGAVDLKTVKLTGFAYLLDYDTRLAMSSQTYGALASGALPLAGKTKLTFLLSYARQSDYAGNPTAYATDYVNGELGVAVAGWGLKGGYELLGSDKGVAAFQTPMATAHAFNGWADLFLTTPNAGLQDYYGTVSKDLGNLGALKGVKAMAVYHTFKSEYGSTDYGSEWDAQVGFGVSRYAFLIKYANYNAKNYGTDTQKLWLQVGVKF